MFLGRCLSFLLICCICRLLYTCWLECTEIQLILEPESVSWSSSSCSSQVTFFLGFFTYISRIYLLYFADVSHIFRGFISYFADLSLIFFYIADFLYSSLPWFFDLSRFDCSIAGRTAAEGLRSRIWNLFVYRHQHLRDYRVEGVLARYRQHRQR